MLTIRLSPKKRPKPKNGCGTVFLGGKTPSNRRRKRATHFGSEPTRDACLRPPSVLLRLHRAESGPLEGDSRSCARVLRRGCWRPEILRCVASLLPATQTHEWVSYLGWLVGDSLSTLQCCTLARVLLSPLIPLNGFLEDSSRIFLKLTLAVSWACIWIVSFYNTMTHSSPTCSRKNS